MAMRMKSGATATMMAIAAVLAASGCKRAHQINKLPARAERAFVDLAGAELISLEPDPGPGVHGTTLHGFVVLGSMPLKPAEAQAAATAIKSAIVQSDGSVAACFNPRHALRTHVQGHTFEALICYDCGSVEVFEDDKLVGAAAVAGSPDALNRILATGHVPVSQSYEGEQARMQAQLAKDEAAKRRWDAAAPASLRFADDDWSMEHGPDLERLDRALAKELPDQDARILVLLRWYGSGSRSWSGYPMYEELPAMLLRRYPTDDIVEVVRSPALSETETEGAARFFGDYNRPSPDHVAMPPAVRRRLLAQGLKTKDSVRVTLAREAFGSEVTSQ